MMTPQLFINYKLKSVAHLPWRAMVSPLPSLFSRLSPHLLSPPRGTHLMLPRASSPHNPPSSCHALDLLLGYLE
jgi:hypothetical protein